MAGTLAGGQCDDLIRIGEEERVGAAPCWPRRFGSAVGGCGRDRTPPQDRGTTPIRLVAPSLGRLKLERQYADLCLSRFDCTGGFHGDKRRKSKRRYAA